MTYQVLARQLRPQRFDDVVGQEHVTRTLQTAIAGRPRRPRLPLHRPARRRQDDHGPHPRQGAQLRAGADRRAVQRLLELPGDHRRQRRRRARDRRRLEHRVDEVRELIETVAHRPTKSRFKIYIIDEVHMLSQHAFNALLKTLEEPPPHVKFIFATTDPHKVPPTVHVALPALRFPAHRPRRLIARRPEADGRRARGSSCPTTRSRSIAREGEGSMRDAQSLLDQVLAAAAPAPDQAAVRGAARRGGSPAWCWRWPTPSSRATPRRCLRQLATLHEHGYDAQRFCRDLLEHFRHLAVLAATGDASLLAELPEAERAAITAQASRRTADELQRIFDLLLETERPWRRRFARSSRSSCSRCRCCVLRRCPRCCPSTTS